MTVWIGILIVLTVLQIATGAIAVLLLRWLLIVTQPLLERRSMRQGRWMREQPRH